MSAAWDDPQNNPQEATGAPVRACECGVRLGDLEELTQRLCYAILGAEGPYEMQRSVRRALDNWQQSSYSE